MCVCVCVCFYMYACVFFSKNNRVKKKQKKTKQYSTLYKLSNIHTCVYFCSTVGDTTTGVLIISQPNRISVSLASKLIRYSDMLI